jgi:hypothetical protein
MATRKDASINSTASMSVNDGANRHRFAMDALVMLARFDKAGGSSERSRFNTR